MYRPKPPLLAVDPKLQPLLTWMMNELQGIAQGARDSVDSLQLNVLHKAPNKPRDGIIVCADGVNWQPLGAGGGYFGYFGGAWVKLG